MCVCVDAVIPLAIFSRLECRGTARPRILLGVGVNPRSSTSVFRRLGHSTWWGRACRTSQICSFGFDFLEPKSPQNPMETPTTSTIVHTPTHKRAMPCELLLKVGGRENHDSQGC